MKEKALYCLSCINKPCKKKCPLENDIPEFIKCIKEDNLEEAYKVLSKTTCLSSICGRICQHSKQCQSNCTRKYKGEPVNIGLLESYIGDLAIKNNWEIPITNKTNYKVAIIGSGPSSLTCAYFLKQNGIYVTIYEKYNELGGILNHSIPEFRLDKNILKDTINKITKDINIITNKELGKDITINELLDNYDVIYIGIGSNISKKYLNNSYGANELLEYNNHPDYTNKIVCINGGGNVAMDIARTIKRLNPKEVNIIYRRSINEMPAEDEEITISLSEGINIIYQTNILDYKDNKLELIKTELKDTGENRLSPVNIEGTNYNIDCDILINAIGSTSDMNVLNNLNIELNNEFIKINDKNQTSNPKIFAGGDVAGTTKTVAFASRSGRDAAFNILEYLNEIHR